MSYHIVVADQSLPTLRALSTIVAHIANVVVHPFSSSAEMLTWAAQNRADAFVISYGLTAPGGLEVVRNLRADARFALVPLIMVSTTARSDARLAAFAAGVHDFVEMPVEPQELTARLQALLALRDAHAQESTRVGLLEAWLRQDQLRLRRQAERFASLWRIANGANASEAELMQEVLDQSTAAMRSGQFFMSSLSRLDGDAVVVEARSFDPDVYSPEQIVPVGTRLLLTDAVQNIPLRTGTTHSWDDIAADPVASRIARVRSAGCRALICTPFTVCGRTFFLTYWSREPAGDPFGSDDDTYVELVAMVFAMRLQQSSQNQAPIKKLFDRKAASSRRHLAGEGDFGPDALPA